MLPVTVTQAALEADLAAGRLRCPGCDGPLRAWGYARERQIRTLHGSRLLRPRRACCEACRVTHVLLPALAVPRRRDSAQVIGAALLAHARGEGHRTIAARLDRPPGTVRGWLRAFKRRADAITRSASAWALTLDNTWLPGRSMGSPVADAINTLGEATRLVRLRLRMRATGWAGGRADRRTAPRRDPTPLTLVAGGRRRPLVVRSFASQIAIFDDAVITIQPVRQQPSGPTASPTTPN